MFLFVVVPLRIRTQTFGFRDRCATITLQDIDDINYVFSFI